MDWNTRLEEITKGLKDCSDEELTYLKEEIQKTQLNKTPFGDV